MKITVQEAGRLGGLARAAKESVLERKTRMRWVARQRWDASTKAARKAAMQPALAARWNGRHKKK